MEDERLKWDERYGGECCLLGKEPSPGRSSAMMNGLGTRCRPRGCCFGKGELAVRMPFLGLLFAYIDRGNTAGEIEMPQVPEAYAGHDLLEFLLGREFHDRVG